MNESKPRLPEALEAPASDQLLDGILAKAANAGQRNAECNSSPAARAKMLFRFEELASSAEAEARLDAEFFEGLRDGQVMKQQLRREHEQREEPAPEVTILAPSTTTKH
jgi:hypothetical protein